MREMRKKAGGKAELTPIEKYYLNEIVRIVNIKNAIRMEPPKILAALARIGLQAIEGMEKRWSTGVSLKKLVLMVLELNKI